MGYAAAILVAIGVYQFYVSVQIARSVYYSQRQKIIQIVLVWLLPLLAAATCHTILISMRRKPRGGDRNFVADDSVNPPGIG